MTKPDHLREYLCREGFRLELENAVISGKFVYTVFSAVYDGVPRELSLLERYIGRVLDGDSADTDRYLMRIRRNLLGRIAGIDRCPERRPGPSDRVRNGGADAGNDFGGAWISCRSSRRSMGS